MRLEFHKEIQSDILRIMEYYEDVAGSQLANEFYAELKVYFQKQQNLSSRTLYASMICDE